MYQSAREQLAQGNKDVRDSARLNAILFARYADRMAENISKITGKEYTAEDYVRERIMLVPNATQVDERGFNQTADEKSRKQKQLELLLATNPMTDDYHTGIRTVDDIRDAEDVLGDGFEEIYPDFTEDMAQKAMLKGKIKIYSSKPLSKQVRSFLRARCVPKTMQAVERSTAKQYW